jgi:hypothetical protein
MNTTNQRPANPQMPKVTQIAAPPPQPRPNRNTEQVYAEQALEVAQRHLDQVAEIDRLGQELEEWRRRAMMAETDNKRYEQREHELRNMLDRRQAELIDERDAYRMRLNSLVAQLNTAGAIVLKCLEAAQGLTGPQISLTKLAEEIERDKHFREVDEPEQADPNKPLPRAVATQRLREHD